MSAFLLLEHPGPWGVNALRDARLPDGVGEELRAHAQAAGVRLLLIRRPGRTPTTAGEPERSTRRIFAVHARAPYSWTETARLGDPREVLDLDLAALRAGRSLGLEAHGEPVFAVCTHGRHDACCAERGRPVAAALARALPEHTWEVSHLGGDRFAANMLVAPDGFYYGRLDPESAVAVARARVAGELELDHLRGRSCYPMPVQAAEIALRRHLGLSTPGGIRLAARVQTGDARSSGLVTDATFAHDGQGYVVRVRSTHSVPVALTCRAVRDQVALQHEIESIERV
ncbi:sucrase ferredoxin [Nocardioides sp. BP30]|uniref:sucrase ferredoxin n=1 Tax=Nocardioides sp. BP30 TaxID=3036374 RepID=UPI0024695858|nr:sucrase ferredoxin [Nocardioides sp. BP30]WGL52290.1 sucrase ferredoxin [Nocardioides sp. BP30]